MFCIRACTGSQWQSLIRMASICFYCREVNKSSFSVARSVSRLGFSHLIKVHEFEQTFVDWNFSYYFQLTSHFLQKTFQILSKLNAGLHGDHKIASDFTYKNDSHSVKVKFAITVIITYKKILMIFKPWHSSFSGCDLLLLEILKMISNILLNKYIWNWSGLLYWN
jgi:hypothetical protein